MSFSDWGNRQQADWKTGPPADNFPTANGFTGHHEMDQHKLVHMGGRVYDPNLGRFLSADVLVQSPYSSQSYNRYTYVSNNPLSRTDPTGYKEVDEVVVTGYKNDYNPYTYNVPTESFFGANSASRAYTNVTIGINPANFTGDSITAINGDSFRGYLTLLTGGILNEDDEFQDEANIQAFQERYGKGITLVAKYGPYAIGLGQIGAGVKLAKGVLTPYGLAKQGRSAAAWAARSDVDNGTTLYRIGTIGKSQAAEAQFWSLEHPLSTGYASRYGIPVGNVSNANFIEAATLKSGASFITRAAPGIGTNVGGGIEVVVPSGGVKMLWFTGIP